MLSASSAVLPASQNVAFAPAERWLQTLPLAAAGARHQLVRSAGLRASNATEGKAKRRREFLLGRECATACLESLGEHAAVGVNEDRSPAWPAGFVGSISHSDRWTWSCVVAKSELASVGVDVEPIVDVVTVDSIREEIGSAGDWSVINQLGGLSREAQFTLLFSAKEAFYKCQYSLCQRPFEFLDASVEGVSSGRLRIGPSPNNAELSRAIRPLDVFFHITDLDVFTVTWLEQRK